VAIVGVCTSGKTTVAAALKEMGYDAYAVSQEHSAVRKLWELRSPDFLVYLDCDLDAVRRRRAVYWGQEMLERQRLRLKDAREHSDLFVDTSNRLREETIEIVERALKARFGGDCVE
jgi:deoxyadenosine/deoxycytidine kinase